MGQKTEEAILEGLKDGDAGAVRRTSIGRLLPLAERIVKELGGCEAVVRCEPAGSLRRFAETGKDIDIVAAVTNRLTASEAFVAQDWVAQVASRGENRVAAVAHDGTVVELRMVAPKVYGNLLQHLTGSQAPQRGAPRSGGARGAQGQRVRHRGRRRSSSIRTFTRDAPNAIRTPISRVRCATRYNITP